MKFEIYDTFPPSMSVSVIEFLIPIFGYGNYSFEKAVSGWEGSGLKTLLVICKNQGLLKGVAFALYSANYPQLAIFGPIAVDEKCRNNGIGREIAKKVLNRLKEIGATAVYLGAKKGHPARKLYGELGFQNHSGVVMRKLFVNSNEFESECFGKHSHLQVRKVSWADYPKFQVLISHPCQMKVFDLRNGYFSSRYFPQKKFLGVFPELMAQYEHQKIDIKVLTSGINESVVGISTIQEIRNKNLKEERLDFFVHDNFINCSGLLIKSSIHNRDSLGATVYSECLSSDSVKKNVLQNNNFSQKSHFEMNIPNYGIESVQNFIYEGKL